MSISVVFLGPMILGNVNVEHPSATIPNFVNGVQKNECSAANTKSQSASVVAAIPIAGPFTTATNIFGKVINASMYFFRILRLVPVGDCAAATSTKGLQPRKSVSFSTSSIMFKSAVFNLEHATGDQVQKFLDSFDTVLTDCDGVLWIDNNAIPGSADTMNMLREKGKRIFYVTNNSTKIRSEFASKAQELGFIANSDEILSTAYLVAHYLKGIGFTKKVYLIGSNGIAGELTAVGIRHLGVGPDVVQPDFKSLKSTDLDPEVGAVVVGFDEHISYPKFMKAASYLSSDECLFVATNTDERFPRAGSIVVPGTGTLVRAVETCSERKALVLGKPHAYVRKYLESCGLDPARTLMIGDRCNTDIELGVRCGFQTLLVLSGVTSEREVENIRSEKKHPLPDVVLPTLGDLLSLIQS